LIGTVHYDVGGGALEPATHTTPKLLEVSALLARMVGQGCKACAMEVSSHALDQQRVAGLEFAAALFTNLTQDHLDYHRNMEAYFKAKSRLFEMVAQQQRGHLIINADDSWGRKLIERFSSTGRVIRYGFGVGLDFRAINPRYDLTGTSFELEAKGRSFLVRMPLIGDFNVHNALAALACVQAAGLNLRESITQLRRAPQVPGRLERVSSDASRFQVFVDYAHTPDALENVLKTLRGLRPRRILTVFGCGGDRDRSKRARMAAAAEAGSDICVVTSDNPRSEDPQAIADEVVRGFARPRQHAVVLDRREAIALVLRNAKPQDLVLIAGKGHEDYQEVMGRRTAFDDRRVVRQLLEDLSVERDAERREQEAARLARDEPQPPPNFDSPRRPERRPPPRR
jgi:UDP-N-acetylmuramoyl-L-alanyl-D-glutamate--2,6-diaminopimelate ligase